MQSAPQQTLWARAEPKCTKNADIHKHVLPMLLYSSFRIQAVQSAPQQTLWARAELPESSTPRFCIGTHWMKTNMMQEDDDDDDDDGDNDGLLFVILQF